LPFYEEVKNHENPKTVEARAYVKKVIDAGEPWTDRDFPPQLSSIQLPGELPEPSHKY